MQQRQLGTSGPLLSVIGLGCNNFGMTIGEEASARVVHAALDAGVTFFDTADIYGDTNSEVFLGRAIAGRREEVVIATKFGMRVDPRRHGARPEYVRQAADDSLRRLGTTYIDLYQLHTPDPTVPIADTLGALDDLVRAGKVREIGCSNFTVEALDESRTGAPPDRARFVSVQNEYSLLHRDPESDVLPACERLGLAFLPYFPLASGLLTGKYVRGTAPPPGTRLSQGWASRFVSDERLATVEALTAYASARGHTMLELSVSWLASQPAVASVIAGATRAEQVVANAAAAGWRLTAAERAEIDRITKQG